MAQPQCVGNCLETRSQRKADVLQCKSRRMLFSSSRASCNLIQTTLGLLLNFFHPLGLLPSYMSMATLAVIRSTRISIYLPSLLIACTNCSFCSQQYLHQIF